MHYHAEIWVPSTNNLEAQIDFIMEPHKEDESEKGFWDWYQIGGRFTGSHDSTYDPTTDPANLETCGWCDGTGFRNDDLGRSERAKHPDYTCNACGTFVEGVGWKHGKNGPGRALKWPTLWVRVSTDISPVQAISNDLKAFTLIANGNVLHQEIWNGKEWVKTEFDGVVKSALQHLGIKDGYLVTVDYHS
jgi:hypothetical protein